MCTLFYVPTDFFSDLNLALIFFIPKYRNTYSIKLTIHLNYVGKMYLVPEKLS